MKKKISVLILMLVFLGLTAVNVRADDTVYSEGYFYYTEKDESITITGYFGQEKYVTVPDSIAGIPVNAIAPKAFADSTVEILYLPDTVVFVGEGAAGDAKVVYAEDKTGKTESEIEPIGSSEESVKPGTSDDGTSGNDGKTESGSTGKSESTSTGKSDGKTDSKAGGKSDGKSESLSMGKTGGKTESDSKDKSDGKSESGSDEKPDDKKSGTAGESDGKTESKADGKSDGKTESKADGKTDNKASGKSDGNSIEGSSDGKNGGTGGKTEGKQTGDASGSSDGKQNSGMKSSSPDSGNVPGNDEVTVDDDFDIKDESTHLPSVPDTAVKEREGIVIATASPEDIERAKAENAAIGQASAAATGTSGGVLPIILIIAAVVLAGGIGAAVYFRRKKN